jgi:hypothetical protein
MTIAIALWFDSGILLCTDREADVPARCPFESSRIFSKSYASQPDGARSVFLACNPGETVATLRHCERALKALPPGEYTIDRMRTAIERALMPAAEADLLIALYSPFDRQCALFRTAGTTLRELIGYDCHGSAAHLGHYLIRDRYRDAQSMDTLDLTTVFEIAIEAVEGARGYPGGCGPVTELAVMYANGRTSNVQHVHQDNHMQRKKAVLEHLASA